MNRSSVNGGFYIPSDCSNGILAILTGVCGRKRFWLPHGSSVVLRQSGLEREPRVENLGELFSWDKSQLLSSEPEIRLDTHLDFKLLRNR